MLDCNDLRYFLAVARDGSTLAAGRALRVSQTTVARRIAALEEALGVHLFEKRQAGYALTPEGQDLLERADQVETAVGAFSDAASARSREAGGIVKITTEEVYAITLLTPLLRDLRDAYPDIVIDLDTSQTVRDLGAGEADISLRSTKAEAPQPAGLVGRQLCVDDWALYCSLWIYYQAWLQSLGLEQQVAMHHATSGGLLNGVRSGFGIAVLPCIVGDGDPDLIQCLPPANDHERTLWLFTHERVRHTPRVRAVVDFLYDQLSKHVRRVQAIRQDAA